MKANTLAYTISCMQAYNKDIATKYNMPERKRERVCVDTVE